MNLLCSGFHLYRKHTIMSAIPNVLAGRYASDLVAGGFPTDVGEGWVNLAIPLVSAIEYVYLGRQYTRMEHVYL